MYLTREYLLEPVQSPDGAWTRKHVFRCSQCPATSEIAKARGGGLMPPEALHKKMSERGWHLGRGADSDLCPACARGLKQKNPTEVVKMRSTKTTGTSAGAIEAAAAAPRLPTFDEKRLILSKLDEVYLDSGRGYSGSWSDKSVAADLGVPWKWVADIREANFGPHAGNEAISEVLAEARALHADIKAHLKEADEKVRAFAAREDSLGKRLADAVKGLA